MDENKYTFIEIDYNGATMPVPVTQNQVGNENGEIKISKREIILNIIDIISSDKSFPYNDMYTNYIEENVGDIRQLIHSEIYNAIKNKSIDTALKYFKIIEKYYGELDEQETEFKELTLNMLEERSTEERKRLIKTLETLEVDVVTENTALRLARLYAEDGYILKAYLYLNKMRQNIDERERIDEAMTEYEISACIEAYNTYMISGRYEDAKKWMNKALKNSELGVLYYYRSLTHAATNDLTQALTDILKAIDREAKQEYYMHAVEIMIQLNEKSSAMNMLEEVLSKEIDAKLKMRAIYYYMQLNEIEIAAEMHERMDGAELDESEIQLYTALEKDIKNFRKKLK